MQFKKCNYDVVSSPLFYYFLDYTLGFPTEGHGGFGIGAWVW